MVFTRALGTAFRFFKGKRADGNTGTWESLTSSHSDEPSGSAPHILAI